MKRFRLRRVVSLSLMLLAAVLTYTGIVLYIAPHGRVAYWSDWHLLGLDKDQLGAIHTTSALSFVILGLLHTWYNLKPIIAYLKDESRRLRVLTPELLAACVLVAAVVIGTGLSLPPFAQVVEVGETAKSWWEEREGSPPYGHAELTSLATMAGKLGLEPAEATGILEAAGWVETDPQRSLLDIGRASDRSPATLYKLLTEAGGDAKSKAFQAGSRRQSGLGRRSLASHCEAEELDLHRSLDLLAQRGVQARQDSTLKEISGALGMTPADLRVLLKE